VSAPSSDLLPPVALRRLVSNTDSEAEYLAIGSAVASMLAQLDMIPAGARMLDVGCGCGRVAQHLLDSEIGAYVGFDRNPELVAWAVQSISSRDGRFEFLYLPVSSPYDEVDGHRGTIAANELEFPAESGSVDSVLLSSVFTHLPLADCRRYLAESRRVLRPGGHVLASWFVIEQGEPDSYGLAYYYPRAALEDLFADNGFTARSLLNEADRERDVRVRSAQEFFLLTRT